MKIIHFLPVAALFCTAFCVARESAPATPDKQQPATTKPVEVPNTPAWVKDFNNLELEKRKEYVSQFSKAEFLFNKKRIVECLRIIDDLDKIFTGNPGLFNLKGACYIEIRDIPKALACFEMARKIEPTNTSVQFNIAETYFIKHDYATAAGEFTKILKELPDNAPVFIRSLLNFKLYICYLKLDKPEEAAKLEGLYDKMDDVPFYYCVQAVKAFNKGDKDAGQAAYMSAITIFQDSGMLQPFGDAMQETGFLPSMAGQSYTGK